MNDYANFSQAYRRWLALAAIVLLATACTPAPSDYETELDSIREKLQALESGSDQQPTPLDRELKRIHLLYTYASLTADYSDLKLTEQTINTAIEQYGDLYDLLLFRARLNLKVHRLDIAKRDLERLSQVARTPEVSAMQGDIALQEGDYPTTEMIYDTLVKQNRGWDKQARQAWYLSKTGRVEEADALYARAQETLSYRQMRHYAWLELQRGILDLDQHHFDQALAHFQRADRAWSGYWLIEEHLAEAFQLTGDIRSARKLYRDIISRSNHPEYFFALAQLEQTDRPERAEALQKKANELFEKRNKLYPKASKSHYLKFLLAHQGNDSRLLDLAEQNYADRPYGDSQLLLAKAYLKLNHREAAREVIRNIMQSPWRTQEIEILAEELNVRPVDDFQASAN